MYNPNRGAYDDDELFWQAFISYLYNPRTSERHKQQWFWREPISYLYNPDPLYLFETKGDTAVSVFLKKLQLPNIEFCSYIFSFLKAHDVFELCVSNSEDIDRTARGEKSADLVNDCLNLLFAGAKFSVNTQLAS